MNTICNLTPRKSWRRLLLIFSFIPLFGAFALNLSAHGGGTPQLINEMAGPFMISVWTLPNPPTTAEPTHFTVALATPDESGSNRGGIVLLNADIELSVEGLDDTQVLSDSVTHEKSSNRFFYETNLEIPDDGMWRANFIISHEGEQGQASFDFEVEPPPSNINWTLIGGLAIALLGVGWFVWQSRQDEQEVLEPVR